MHQFKGEDIFEVYLKNLSTKKPLKYNNVVELLVIYDANMNKEKAGVVY